MLDGLHDHDWDSIKISDIGPTAKEVPTLLENIVATTDEDEQFDWFTKLDQYVFWHDDASLGAPLIVPFLIELLKMDHIQIKANIIHSMYYLRLSSTRYRLMKERPTHQKFSVAIIKTHEVIIDNLPVYLPLLDSTDFSTRFWTYHLLTNGFHAEDIPTIIDHFIQRSQIETSRLILYNIFRGLGDLLRENRKSLGDKFQRTINWLEHQHTNDNPFPLPIGIDFGLVSALRGDTPDIVLDRLANVLLHPEAIREQFENTDAIEHFKEFPSDFLYHDAIYCVKWMSDERLLIYWKRLLAQTDNPKQARRLANRLMIYYFPGGNYLRLEEEEVIENGKPYIKCKGRIKLRPPKELKPIQKQVLQIVVEADRVWQEPHNLLEAYGLPADREDARKLLNA